MTEFERRVKSGKLAKVQPDKDWIEKEMEASEYDLEMAKASSDNDDFKWAIIQSYYSMFHAAKALVLKE